jgi:hypothetical protein
MQQNIISVQLYRMSYVEHIFCCISYWDGDGDVKSVHGDGELRYSKNMIILVQLSYNMQGDLLLCSQGLGKMFTDAKDIHRKDVYWGYGRSLGDVFIERRCS